MWSDGDREAYPVYGLGSRQREQTWFTWEYYSSRLLHYVFGSRDNISIDYKAELVDG